MKKAIFLMIMTVFSACSMNLSAQNVDIDQIGSTLDVDLTDSSIVVYGSMGATNPAYFFAEAITGTDTLYSDTVLYIGSLVSYQWTINGFSENQTSIVKICGVDTTTGNRVCTYQIPAETAWAHILPNSLVVSVGTRTYTSVSFSVTGNFGANALIHLTYKRNGGATQTTSNVSGSGYGTSVSITISGLQPGDQLTQVKPYANDVHFGLASGPPISTSTLSATLPDVNGLVSTSVGQTSVTTQVNAVVNDQNATLKFARRVTGSGAPLTILSPQTLVANQTGVVYSHTGLLPSTSYDFWAIIVNTAGSDSTMITRVTTGLPDDVLTVAISNSNYYSFDATASMTTQNSTSFLSLYQKEDGVGIDSVVGILIAQGTHQYMNTLNGLPGHSYTVTGKLERQSDGAMVSISTSSFTLPSLPSMTNTLTSVTSGSYYSVSFTNNLGTGYGNGMVYQMVTDSITGIMYDSLAQAISSTATIPRVISALPPNRTVKITALLVRDADSLSLETVKYKKLTVMPSPTITITSTSVVGNDGTACFHWSTVDQTGAGILFILGNELHQFNVPVGTGDTCFTVNDLEWGSSNTVVVTIVDTVGENTQSSTIIIGSAPANPQINIGNADTTGLAYGWIRVPITVVSVGSTSGEVRLLKGLSSNSIHTPVDSLTVSAGGTYDLFFNYAMYSPGTYVYYTGEMDNTNGGYVLYESYNWFVVPSDIEPLPEPVFLPNSAVTNGTSTILSFNCTANGNDSVWGYFTVYPPNSALYNTDTIWIGPSQNGSFDSQLLGLAPGVYGFKLHGGMGSEELYTGEMDYFTINGTNGIEELIHNNPNTVVQIYNLNGQLVGERKYSELLHSGVVSAPGIYIIADRAEGKQMFLK